MLSPPIVCLVIGVALLLIANQVTGLTQPVRAVCNVLGGILVVLGGVLLLIALLGGTAHAEGLYQIQQFEKVTPRLDPPATLAISGVAAVLTQLVKFAGVPDKWGIVVVFVISALGVAAWGISNETMADRVLLWPYFAAWVNVTASAAGFFGFIRAISPGDATSTRRPPSGAAQGYTEKLGNP